MQLDDESFDLVVSSECIEHTPDPTTSLEEMYRIAKPGSYIVVTSPNRVWYLALWLATKLQIRKYEGTEIWLYPSEAAEVFMSLGGDLTRKSGCHLFPWQLPLAKCILPKIDRWADSIYPIMINYGIVCKKS